MAFIQIPSEILRHGIRVVRDQDVAVTFSPKQNQIVGNSQRKVREVADPDDFERLTRVLVFSSECRPGSTT
jgi:hypothetical protein